MSVSNKTSRHTATQGSIVASRLQLLIDHGLGEAVGCLAGYDGKIKRAKLAKILGEDLATKAVRALESRPPANAPTAASRDTGGASVVDHTSSLAQAGGTAQATNTNPTSAELAVSAGAAAVPAGATSAGATSAGATSAGAVSARTNSHQPGDTAMVCDTRAPKARRWQPPPVGSASAKLQRVVVTTCLRGGDGWIDALAMLVAPDATTRHGVNAAALADATYVVLGLACGIGHVDVLERALASDAACVEAALSTASYTSVPLFVSACQVCRVRVC